MSKLKIFTDGASRGNPGTSGIGIIIYDENDITVDSYREYIGESTNNQAEYSALLKSVEIITKIIQDNPSYNLLEFYSDSELMVKQVKGMYKLKNPALKVLNTEFQKRINKTGLKYTINHIQREYNKAADKLANEAIDFKIKP